MPGWIGVDLDGTLAHYDSWRGVGHIGEPIPLMVERVKAWLEREIDVRILTARVGCRDPSDPGEAPESLAAIEAWCLEHIGQVLPVTCQKDYGMFECWDDRSIQIITNTGKRADGLDG